MATGGKLIRIGDEKPILDVDIPVYGWEWRSVFERIELSPSPAKVPKIVRPGEDIELRCTSETELSLPLVEAQKIHGLVKMNSRPIAMPY
ncbi:unnamed protein product [Prunus armeniaca]|uniref:Uncharacterized protein n=1 Tax=Prunus armeniaca TaxID=36596 RepID=A0A6J5UPS7_PRUAR|nr:unnamed protein product [Prunus armeniaca]